jgi:hypothetical protein
VRKRLQIFSSLFFLIFIALSLTGCGAGGSDAFRYDPGIPAQPNGVKAVSGYKMVSLSWTPVSSATSYNIYYAGGPGVTGVTKESGTKITVTTMQWVVAELQNDTTYYFMVTAVNRDGEGVGSTPVAATPGSFTSADITGDWNYHTLVTGTGAKWMRGKMTVDSAGSAVLTNFLDSSGNTTAPAGFVLAITADGEITQSGAGASPDFYGILASRKNMIIATSTPAAGSAAVTIFQKRDPTVVFSEDDISGTGSQGNGPTRYVYHQISSGSSTEWEYGNAKVGRFGQFWTDLYKDIIYWDRSTPTYKLMEKYDWQWKVTSIGIDPDGFVTEYNNLSANHEVLFTGMMSADKTVIIGIKTYPDTSTFPSVGSSSQYALRAIQLCFRPADEALPTWAIGDLKGTYRFLKINSTAATWAYGTISATAEGIMTFPRYMDGLGNTSFPDILSFSYYPDNGIKLYTDFPNFTTANLQDGASRYYNGGTAYYDYYDYWSAGYSKTNPRLLPESTSYYNEHCSLSYNRDFLVMTRTEPTGYTLSLAVR